MKKIEESEASRSVGSYRSVLAGSLTRVAWEQNFFSRLIDSDGVGETFAGAKQHLSQ